MNCETKIDVYLISCKRCGIQYIGETSQTLRSRINNHRNRLKRMCDLYRHSEDNILVMPTEEVKLEEGESKTPLNASSGKTTGMTI